MPCQTTCVSSAPAADAPLPQARPLAARLLGVVRKAWHAYWEQRARRATILVLHSLDARTLRDIGISPGEIESLTRCSGDRRRRYDGARPCPHDRQ